LSFLANQPSSQLTNPVIEVDGWLETELPPRK
jgi:hypothetical protein